MELTSRQNETVQLFRGLIRDKKIRLREEGFVVEGAKFCEEAFSSGCEMRFFLYTRTAEQKYTEIVQKIKAVVPSAVISESLCAYIADTDSPQGLFLHIKSLDKQQNLYKIKKNNNLVLALDTIQDTGNIGTIIRSSEAFGAEKLFLSEGCGDIYSPKTVRASAGSLFRFPCIRCNLVDTIHEYASKGYTIYGAMLDTSALPLTQAAKLNPKAFVVIGNEGRGISPEIRPLCQSLYIPIQTAESLNAAIAASIILWEFSKQSS